VKVPVLDGDLVRQASDEVLGEYNRSQLQGTFIEDFDEDEEAPVLAFLGRGRREQAI
jgi:hypothetical protein